MKLTARKFKQARADRKSRISISALVRKYGCSRNEMIRVIQAPSLEYYLLPVENHRVPKKPEQVRMPFDGYSPEDIMREIYTIQDMLKEIIHYTSATNAR